MKLIIIVCSLVLLSMLLFSRSFSTVMQSLPYFLFRLGFSLFLLFGIHLLLGLMGYTVQVNLFTGMLVAVLGVPGVASVVAITLLV